jgi:hypothetical protein
MEARADPRFGTATGARAASISEGADSPASRGGSMHVAGRRERRTAWAMLPLQGRREQRWDTEPAPPRPSATASRQLTKRSRRVRWQ